MNDDVTKLQSTLDALVNSSPSSFPLRQVILTFAIFGGLVAAAMMYIAWEHNSQGEIHDETGVHWGYWLLLGSTWLVAIGVVPSVLASLFAYLSRLLRRT